MSRRIPILIAVVASSVLATRADAANRFVAPCGNDAWAGANINCIPPLGPKRTIQAAIQSSLPGDQITVLPGTYDEAIDLDGKAIRILGLSGPDVTILNGDGAEHTVTCNSGETAATIIEGLSISGGSANGSGGGMFINFSSPTVIDCEIINNEAGTTGGGVSIALGSPSFEGCTIAGNEAGTSGGGVHVASGSPTFVGCDILSNNCSDFGGGVNIVGGSPAIDDCEINFNDAQHGAGVALQTGSLALAASTMVQNEAASSGGGLYVGDATATLTGMTIVGNFAHTSGGGIAVATGGTLDIGLSDISGNVINSPFAEPVIAHGGGIRAVNASVTGHDLLFAENEAFYGGGLSAQNSDINLTDSTFQLNDGSDDTGGLLAEAGSHAVLDDVHFVANTSYVAGGASIVDSTLEMTGGSISEHNCSVAAALGVLESVVHLDDVVIADNHSAGFVAFGVVTIASVEEGDVLFESCDFIANSAVAGGAAYLTDGYADFVACGFLANSGVFGGAIASDEFVGPATIRLRDCSFQSNDAEYGGAAHMSSGATIEAVNSSFFLNHATETGGAIYAVPLGFDLVNCSIYDNSADGGAGVYLGGPLLGPGGATMTNCRVTGNEAVDEGGGLYIGLDTLLAITNCTIADNTAGGAGSAMTVHSDEVEVANSIIWSNSGVQVNGSGDPDFRYSIIPPFQSGPGCFSADPLFINPGAGDYRLFAISPAADAGVNALLPSDFLDADGDGDTSELIDVDRLGDLRIQLAELGDSGCSFAVVDLGAFEIEGEESEVVILSADLNNDGAVGFADLLILLAAWGDVEGCQLVDLNGDGMVGFTDLLIMLANWS